MEFIAILGDRGSGKSNLMTAFLKQAHDRGEKVIANYKLSFPYELKSFEDIAKMGKDIANSVIGLDELGVGADSYDFFMEGPRKITQFISQIRKRRCVVYYTDQRWNKIHKRLRDQTDGFIIMSDLDSPHPSTDFDCSGLFRSEFYDEDLEFIDMKLFEGKPYWKYYDTNEIIWG